MALDTIDERIEPIAIIGIGCRFPGASNTDEFRDNLLKGKESVSFFSKSEMLDAGADKTLINKPNYLNSGRILESIEMFDPGFFGYTSAEAEFICPQQRIFLECAYEALEDAGCQPHRQDSDIGVFGGVQTSGYASVLEPVLRETGSVRAFEALLGTSVDQLCMRVSHALNFKGPSMSIQTACSASIAAIHIACESLRNGECSMALAGASSISIPQSRGYIYDHDMIFSPDGYCRAFDAKAQGTVAGNGAGMVLLRPLSDAINHHDHIYAVIRASAVNNDGSEKAAYRTPSLEGQAQVIEEALLMSGIDPESITYVEANGTGTLLGDSIEIEALSRVFRMTTDKKQYCGIGSVKTNIGHLAQAAGVAGLIKTVLALKYKELYPSLHCDTPNPSLIDSPFYVVREPMKWNVDNGTRRAGLNSFATGGSNAHLILEEAPLPERTSISEMKCRPHIFTISTKEESTLKRMGHKYKLFLESNPKADIEDICFTSNVGRYHYPCRFSSVAGSKEELLKQINNWLNDKEDPPGFAADRKKCQPQIGFLFSDSLDARFLKRTSFYGRQTRFSEAIDQCHQILQRLGDFRSSSCDLKKFYAAPPGPITTFILEYALASMWESWGIVPAAAMGNGIGKYVAACISGALSLENGLSQAIKARDFHPSFPSPDPKISQMVSTLEFNSEQTGENADFLILMGPDKQILQQQDLIQDKTVVYLYQGDENEWYDTLQCLHKLYTRGKDIAWDRVTEALPYYKIPLPTYAFEKKPCWFSS